MRNLLLVCTLAVVSLAGCTSLEIPADAAVDRDDALPKATMHAWVEEFDGFATIYGVFQDRSGDLLKVDIREPFGAWRVNISDEEGTELIFDERATCHFPWPELVGPNVHEEFRFTWRHTVYESYADCKSGQQFAAEPAGAGNYTVTVQFRLSDLDDDSFELELPFRVQ